MSESTAQSFSEIRIHAPCPFVVGSIGEKGGERCGGLVRLRLVLSKGARAPEPTRNHNSGESHETLCLVWSFRFMLMTTVNALAQNAPAAGDTSTTQDTPTAKTESKHGFEITPYGGWVWTRGYDVLLGGQRGNLDTRASVVWGVTLGYSLRDSLTQIEVIYSRQDTDLYFELWGKRPKSRESPSNISTSAGSSELRGGARCGSRRSVWAHRAGHRRAATAMTHGGSPSC